jgi:hypothetical protein
VFVGYRFISNERYCGFSSDARFDSDAADKGRSYMAKIIDYDKLIKEPPSYWQLMKLVPYDGEEDSKNIVAYCERHDTTFGLGMKRVCLNCFKELTATPERSDIPLVQK